MEFLEFKDRINKLQILLQDPQAGLMSWNMMLGQSMNELISRWNESAVPAKPQVDLEIIKALERAKILLRDMTVREVFEIGTDAINASGLNPWCMNEGRSTGEERISTSWLTDAIKLAKGEFDEDL